MSVRLRRLVCGWLSPRLAKLAVWVGLVVVGVWASIAYVFLCLTHPTAAVLVASHGVVFLGGLGWRDRRRARLEVVAGWHDEEIDAIKRADTRRDSGEHDIVIADPVPEEWVLHPPYAQRPAGEVRL